MLGEEGEISTWGESWGDLSSVLDRNLAILAIFPYEGGVRIQNDNIANFVKFCCIFLLMQLLGVFFLLLF